MAIYRQDGDLVLLGVHKGDRAPRGAIQGAGVDHVRGSNALVSPLVGVAMEDVLVQAAADGWLETALVSVKDGKLEAVPGELVRRRRPVQPESLQLGSPGGVGKVGVAPDELQRAAGELLQHLHSSDVPAMHEALGPGRLQPLDGLPNRPHPPVAVRHDAHLHARNSCSGKPPGHL